MAQTPVTCSTASRLLVVQRVRTVFFTLCLYTSSTAHHPSGTTHGLLPGSAWQGSLCTYEDQRFWMRGPDQIGCTSTTIAVIEYEPMVSRIRSKALLNLGYFRSPSYLRNIPCRYGAIDDASDLQNFPRSHFECKSSDNWFLQQTCTNRPSETGEEPMQQFGGLYPPQ